MKEFERIKIYEKHCFLYGFLVLLILMDMHEREGNYSEASLIYNAISNLNNKINADLPTKYNSDAVAYYVNSFQENKDIFPDVKWKNPLPMKELKLYAQCLKDSI